MTEESKNPAPYALTRLSTKVLRSMKRLGSDVLQAMRRLTFNENLGTIHGKVEYDGKEINLPDPFSLKDMERAYGECQIT